MLYRRLLVFSIRAAILLIMAALVATIPLPSLSRGAHAAGDVVAPVLAWYYPQFSQGLQTDLRNAAAAKIDALVVSETGARDLGGYLAAAQGSGVHITAGIEPQTYANADALAQRLRQIITVDAANPSFLRYQGKPVLVFWQPPSVPAYPGQTTQQTWQSIRQKADPQRTSIWIAEGGDPNSTLSYLPAFDGLHLYSIAWAADPAGQLNNWANRVRSADASKLWVATVMPGGYWGSGSDPSQWQYREREDGGYYRRTWEGAIATNPAMVIITSFNETKERTEVHPTPQWGTRYLDITREMGDLWRARFPVPPPTSQAFPETGQTVRGAFYSFFTHYGGLDRFGYPITAEVNDAGRTVQYFQRARMELFPEFGGTPWEVQLTLLGDLLTEDRRPFATVEAFVSSPGHRYFPETAHGVHGAFLRHFDERGGLESFGYPISEEMVEDGMTVQYFQRARFEYHPQHAGTPYEVQLGLLGDQFLTQQIESAQLASASAVTAQTLAPTSPLSQPSAPATTTTGATATKPSKKGRG